MKKLFVALPIFLTVMFIFAGMASAHVKVHPYEVEQGTYQTFTVSMPVEKDANTTKLKLEFSDGVTVTGVEPKPGWAYELKKDDSGKITAIVWEAEDKGIAPNEFVEMKFQGKVGDDAKQITFKGYQTYDNGDVVKWIEDQESDNPASVTKVVTAGDDDQKAAKDTFGLTFNMSIAALILGIIAIVMAAMKRKK